MKNSSLKNINKRLFSILAALLVLLSSPVLSIYASAVVFLSTQYSYDTADPAWLSDLIIKEDMTSVTGLSTRCELVPVCDYPYSETPDSFREKLSYYETLYTLDQSNMSSTAYLYLLDLAAQFSDAAKDETYSDDYIRNYLEGAGIVWPTSGNQTETDIVARALFAILASDPSYKITSGTGLYEAFISYFSKLIGVDLNTITRFDSDSAMTDLQDYVLAAARYALYRYGYNVTSDTPAEEVYRLTAVMTVQKQGISIDPETATFEEIKMKYLCAMICGIYDVPADPAAFQAAYEADELPVYMLQLIGKSKGITVRNGTDYDTAFALVRDNTDYFALEKGEFYADIYQYNVKLKYLCSRLWVNPESYIKDSDGISVKIDINGTEVRSAYYNEIPLDKNVLDPVLTITVKYSQAGNERTRVYNVNITQGTTEVPVSGSVSSALSSVANIAENAMIQLGETGSFSELMKKIPFTLSESVFSIASLLFPSTDGVDFFSFVSQVFGYALNNASKVTRKTIGGIGGLDAFNATQKSSGTYPMAVSFNTVAAANGSDINSLTVITPSQNTALTPANPLIIPDADAQAQNNEIVDKKSNPFRELLGDTTSLIVLSAVLVAIFAVCLVMFSGIFRYSGEAASLEGKARPVRSPRKTQDGSLARDFAFKEQADVKSAPRRRRRPEGEEVEAPEPAVLRNLSDKKRK